MPALLRNFAFAGIVIAILAACGGDSSDDSDDAETPKDTEKLVFISSETFTGNLGGTAGADANCQRLADAVPLDGKYKAWISTTTESPATSFKQAKVPYVLVDDTMIAANWADLTDGSIDNPINLDENGMPAPAAENFCGGTFSVHTATTDSGLASAPATQSCSSFTSELGGSSWGFYNRAAFGWSSSCFGGAPVNLCGRRAPIYCFEQ